MCGILLHYHPNTSIDDGLIGLDEAGIIKILNSETNSLDFKFPQEDDLYNSLVPKICARGPDYAINLNYDQHFSLFSSVLSLRTPFTKQPLVSSDYILQFNGELYNDDIEGNDTEYILDKLLKYRDVSKTINELDGEFAFMIYDIKNKVISFGRDPIGKRSLVYSLGDNNEIFISSINPTSRDYTFLDCHNGSIYQYDLNSKSLQESPNTHLYIINDKIDEDYNHLSERLQALNTKLLKSVRQRIETIQPLHEEKGPLFSILFSGGLDCTIIAGLSALLSKQGTTIDLLNVGFNNPRTGLTASEAPDRKLGIESWLNLQTKFPLVKFNFIEINVPYEEYVEIRPKVIDLMYPKNTEMDLSIAIAFYFASRRKGDKLETSSSYDEAKRTQNYQSVSKVLLSGLGADELYGGYHKFANKDLPGLIEELTRQIGNIHKRNLQRDDKVIADNGVEVRYPFLSHDVIEYSTSGIEINYKISKFILREYSKMIGLDFISNEPKRAIQFGAKSAKMTNNGNKKGTDELK